MTPQQFLNRLIGIHRMCSGFERDVIQASLTYGRPESKDLERIIMRMHECVAEARTNFPAVSTRMQAQGIEGELLRILDDALDTLGSISLYLLEYERHCRTKDVFKSPGILLRQPKDFLERFHTIYGKFFVDMYSVYMSYRFLFRRLNSTLILKKTG